ncbi:hypothetical protein DM02DRAFT_159330 [Periconia macrospinosa]|uniref:Glycoside hydrolase family 18 protein n=1 Tax=Periconia macrospinosa TaxID=97972 RepID=A0A2V1E5X3_9PLEO|nr:hypothetical protein DM02DRAFT_159330 [Periconia macrospinosa]
MHWCTTLLALAAVPIVSSLPLSLPSLTPKTQPQRAVWLWNSDIIKDDTAVSKFFSTASAPSNKFTTVYALIDRDMGNDAWQSFVSKCNSSGIAVEGLMGDSQWILGRTSDDGPTFQHSLDWIKQYQASVPDNAKLAGIHLDVEPWGLDGWEANKDEYVGELVSIVGKTVEAGKALGLPVAADLPFWANTVDCEDTKLDAYMAKKLDSITFMTYRASPLDLLDVASPVLKTVSGLGKKAYVSVETASNVADASLISYAGKALGTLVDDLSKVEQLAMAHSGFSGIAVHDYKSLVAMSG